MPFELLTDTSERQDTLNPAQLGGAYTGPDIRTRSIWIPISIAEAEIGTPALGTVGSGTDKIRAWAFDGSASERIVFDEVLFPSDMLSTSTIVPVLHWAPSDTNTGNVVWQFNYAFLDSDDQVDESYTTGNTTSAAPAVADQKVVVTLTTTVGKKTNDVSIKIAVARLAATAGDTYDAHDAWLTGLELRYQAVSV